MKTLKQRWKKLVDAFFPPVPTRKKPRPKTVAKLVSEGYSKLHCTRRTYSALVNLMPPADATEAVVKGMFGVSVSFVFNELVPYGQFVPMKDGFLLYEEAMDV